MPGDKTMTQCGSSQNEDPSLSTRLACPACGKKGLPVSHKTILHHLRSAWQYPNLQKGYYFCRSADCAVVYFDNNANIFTKSDVRTRIGIKEATDDALICFCFGVSNADVIRNNSIKEFVTQQTKDENCSCAWFNPSGRCCLRDF